MLFRTFFVHLKKKAKWIIKSKEISFWFLAVGFYSCRMWSEFSFKVILDSVNSRHLHLYQSLAFPIANKPHLFYSGIQIKGMSEPWSNSEYFFLYFFTCIQGLIVSNFIYLLLKNTSACCHWLIIHLECHLKQKLDSSKRWFVRKMKMFCNAILLIVSVNLSRSLVFFHIVWFPYAIIVVASLFSFQKKWSSLQASFLACYQIHWESAWNSCVKILLHQCLCFMALSVSFKVSSCWKLQAAGSNGKKIIACLILFLTLNFQQWAYYMKQVLLLKKISKLYTWKLLIHNVFSLWRMKNNTCKFWWAVGFFLPYN